MADEEPTYEQSAVWYLEAAARQEKPERVAELQRRAQTFATLALAEQQRVSNVIALGVAVTRGVRTDLGLAVEADQGIEHEGWQRPPAWKIRPEIAKVLGLEGDVIL